MKRIPSEDPEQGSLFGDDEPQGGGSTSKASAQSRRPSGAPARRETRDPNADDEPRPRRSDYDAKDIEVLSGLDPVKRRPGMYTDTERPNHLAQEVIDNSVDEALAGFASKVAVTLHQDGSLSVEDDGRGMPVDKHPEEKVPGVEVIFTKLHSGGKFGNKAYRFSGGLHGVGVSVVNALSERLEAWIKRNGKVHHIVFEHGDKVQNLKVIDSVGQRNTGTTVRFWPHAPYFAQPKFALPKLRHLLRAKAVLCPGLRVSLTDEQTGEKDEWHFVDGLSEYLAERFRGQETVPAEPYVGKAEMENEGVEWAVLWAPEANEGTYESYVNLIPTIQGGTHVNGLRLGLTEAVREFCEIRSLLPRGVKLSPEDVWDGCSYVLSLKMLDPQFAGQTKERLSSRECATFVSGVVKDAFSLWLNQHTEIGQRIAELAIDRAQQRLRAGKKVTRKKITSGPALPGKLKDCTSTDLNRTELFLVEGDSAGGSAHQARDREFQAVMPLRGKILNTWEVDHNDVLRSQEVHDISVAIGVEPGSNNLKGLRYGKVCILADADSDGLHIATLLCALFLKHFRPLVEAGHVYVCMPPLYRVDVGKQVYYALDDHELQGVLDRIEAEKIKGKVSTQRFKGLGEMNPKQLRETTIAPESRRLLRLTIETQDEADRMLDMLLAKKRASDRKAWLEDHGDRASLA